MYFKKDNTSLKSHSQLRINHCFCFTFQLHIQQKTWFGFSVFELSGLSHKFSKENALARSWIKSSPEVPSNPFPTPTTVWLGSTVLPLPSTRLFFPCVNIYAPVSKSCFISFGNGRDNSSNFTLQHLPSSLKS